MRRHKQFERIGQNFAVAGHTGNDVESLIIGGHRSDFDFVACRRKAIGPNPIVRGIEDGGGEQFYGLSSTELIVRGEGRVLVIREIAEVAVARTGGRAAVDDAKVEFGSAVDQPRSASRGDEAGARDVGVHPFITRSRDR